MEGRRRKKKPLSRLAKTFLSYALIAALALPTQAAWADGQSLADGDAAGDGSLAVGEGAGAYAEGSIAIGRNAVAETDGEYALAVGYSAKASGKNSVAIGYNSVASEANTVSVGGNGTTRRIVNVAEGTADTDAATVGQLASLGSQVAGIVGTNIAYNGDSFTGAINIGGTVYNTIEKALNALYDGTAGSTGGAVAGDKAAPAEKPAEKPAQKPAEAPKAAGQPHKDRKAKKPAAAREATTTLDTRSAQKTDKVEVRQNNLFNHLHILTGKAEQGTRRIINFLTVFPVFFRQTELMHTGDFR